jgi:Sulfotransferase domain
VPADRLLVYEVTHGWEPLCAFLGVPVPDEPFPSASPPR